MKRWLSRLGWLTIGAAATSLAIGLPVRRHRASEVSAEVAVDGRQAFVHIPMFDVGYQTSPAGVVQAVLMGVLSPFAVMLPTHRINHQTIIVIDARGAWTMKFQGVSGPFQVTSDGPVVRVGDQLCRWTGGALVTLTPAEGDAVQRDYTGPVRPPWSKRGIVFWQPAKVIPFTLDGSPYQLEAHAASDVKTLTLIDPQGGRQVLWSLDQAFRPLSADQFRERFR